MTGNTIVDAVYQNLDLANRERSILNDLELKPKGYLLVTAHRQENVDVRDRFEGILNGLHHINQEYGMPVIYPIHPRARKMMNQFGIQLGGINLIEPVDYLSFLQLESQAKLVLTDSGGVQEESCILQVPCVTLRDNTERPETVAVGANVLAGTDPVKIQECTASMLERANEWQNPFGDGTAGERIVGHLKEKVRS